MEDNNGHAHAELRAQYAEDAKTHAKPWELWQFLDMSGWHTCVRTPGWFESAEYRRKPKTHIVNGIEIPDLRIDPKEGDKYYLVDPTERYFNHYYTHTGSTCDELWVTRRLCYEPTEDGEQAAILHAKAMLGIA